jgi:hypothetical protein
MTVQQLIEELKRVDARDEVRFATCRDEGYIGPGKPIARVTERRMVVLLEEPEA